MISVKKALAQKTKMERAGKNNRGGKRGRGVKMIEFVNPIDITVNLIQIFHQNTIRKYISV